MVPHVVVVAALLPVFYFFSLYRRFRTNLQAAKASGIPYVILPIYMLNRVWMMTSQLWLPAVKMLPDSWTKNRIEFLDPEWAWYLGHKPFRQLKTDFFLTVSPGGILGFTCDADVISQIVSRRNDFPKPLEMYGMLNIFGRNVVSTEGPLWRQHRKITAPPFTERNNALVWKESLSQAQVMLRGWVGESGKGDKTVTDFPGDTMRLPLHVISFAGFGVRMMWPAQEGEILDTGEKATRIGCTVAPEGHTMSYSIALWTLLQNILWVLLLPRWLLKHSPLEIHKQSYTAYIEWGQYMRQLFEKKKAGIREGELGDGLDLMGVPRWGLQLIGHIGSLVKGAGTITDTQIVASETEGSKILQLLTDDEIMGNAFVFILAGHETTASTLQYSLLSLALNTSAQRRLQQDLDHQFGKRSITSWDYETDVPALFGGMTGAVMNETLRCFPPVISIPKRATRDQPQTLLFQGKEVTVPRGVKISLSVVAAHQNPKYWPGDDPRQFRPERWFVDLHSAKQTGVVNSNTLGGIEDVDDTQGGDAAASLFRPLRGAFIPFSEGYRACLGRRFAQVEILAVLAVLFREYSIELAVDEWVSDEDVDKMPVGGSERSEVWGKAAKRARWLMHEGSGTVITLKLRGGQVPVRWTRRGEERFAF
ncbi:MAG: hypothetical protein M1840_004017 [Geoglossum simile]|nr:MAG: hypothetical protein M1840_004017 [Geoglossum simile]